MASVIENIISKLRESVSDNTRKIFSFREESNKNDGSLKNIIGDAYKAIRQNSRNLSNLTGDISELRSNDQITNNKIDSTNRKIKDLDKNNKSLSNNFEKLSRSFSSLTTSINKRLAIMDSNLRDIISSQKRLNYITQTQPQTFKIPGIIGRQEDRDRSPSLIQQIGGTILGGSILGGTAFLGGGATASPSKDVGITPSRTPEPTTGGGGSGISPPPSDVSAPSPQPNTSSDSGPLKIPNSKFEPGTNSAPGSSRRVVNVPYVQNGVRVPASIRYNNPGASYPRKRDELFGVEGYGIIGGGHKIGKYPSVVHGAASNIDLFSRSRLYLGQPLWKAVKTWRGGNGHIGVPKGFDPNEIVDEKFIRDKDKMLRLFKAFSHHEAGRKKVPITPEMWEHAWNMAQAGGVSAYKKQIEKQKGGDNNQKEGQKPPTEPPPVNIPNGTPQGTGQEPQGTGQPPQGTGQPPQPQRSQPQRSQPQETETAPQPQRSQPQETAPQPQGTGQPPQTQQNVGRVVQKQMEVAGIRKRPISNKLKNVLEYAAKQAGVEVVIFSGGQRGKHEHGHGKRIGSTRHDYGHAADLDLYITEGGKRRKLNPSNKKDRQIMQKFIYAAAQAGATGIGHGRRYMGPGRLHVGFGKVATWGDGMESTGFNSAFYAGRENPIDIDKYNFGNRNNLGTRGVTDTPPIPERPSGIEISPATPETKYKAELEERVETKASEISAKPRPTVSTADILSVMPPEPPKTKPSEPTTPPPGAKGERITPEQTPVPSPEKPDLSKLLYGTPYTEPTKTDTLETSPTKKRPDLNKLRQLYT